MGVTSVGAASRGVTGGGAEHAAEQGAAVAAEAERKVA
jgi:hypothetical protein